MGKQSSIAIVGRNGARETTVSPRAPVPTSQLDIRFIDIFSQSFERLYLLLYNVVYLALVHRRAAARATTRLVSDRAGRWSIRSEGDSRNWRFNRETDRCLYKFYFEHREEKICVTIENW